MSLIVKDPAMQSDHPWLNQPDPYDHTDPHALCPPNIGGNQSIGTERPVRIAHETVRTKAPERTEQKQATEDAETSAGAEPLDELLAELDHTEGEWASLGALYGPGGTFDHLRKARLSVIALSIRDERVAKGEKVTDGLVDTLAHADSAYIAFLDGHTIARARYLELCAKRDGIMARVNRGQALIRYAARAA